MARNLTMFGISIVVVSLITLTIIGFLSGLSNPLPWVSLAFLITIVVGHNHMIKRRYLTWDDSYSVGIDSIDGDHKKLIHLINNLQTTIDYKTDREFERQILNQVIDYTHYHFGREEEMMEKYDYPDFAPHKAKHEIMIEKVNYLVQAYEKDEANAIESLLEYLKSWLIKHIKGTDKEYSEFLISKGAR